MMLGKVMNRVAVIMGAGLLAVGCQSSNPAHRDGGNWPDSPDAGVYVAPAPQPAPVVESAPAPFHLQRYVQAY